MDCRLTLTNRSYLGFLVHRWSSFSNGVEAVRLSSDSLSNWGHTIDSNTASISTGRHGYLSNSENICKQTLSYQSTCTFIAQCSKIKV